MPSTTNVSQKQFDALCLRVAALEKTIATMTLASLKDVSTEGATDNAVLGFDATAQTWTAMNEE